MTIESVERQKYLRDYLEAGDRESAARDLLASVDDSELETQLAIDSELRGLGRALRDLAGKAVVQFKVAMPMIKRDAARGKGKVVVFELPVPLDIAPPAPNTWRMPAAPEKK